MEEIVKIALDEFEKKPDGSWVSVKNVDVVTKSGNVIRIAPGLTFKKGGQIWGVDIAAKLDEMSAG